MLSLIVSRCTAPCRLAFCRGSAEASLKLELVFMASLGSALLAVASFDSMKQAFAQPSGASRPAIPIQQRPPAYMPSPGASPTSKDKASGTNQSTGITSTAGSTNATNRAITATTGLVTIESDLQQADNGTGVVTATGNVRIVYPDQRVVATARQAQYFTKEGRVVLSGDVDVVQEDGHTMRAERVTYFVNQERLIAEPPAGSQVVIRYRLNTAASKTTPLSRP